MTLTTKITTALLTGLIVGTLATCRLHGGIVAGPQDCVPVCLFHLAQINDHPVPLARWMAACGPDSEGVDIETIAPTWEKLEPSYLVAIYVVEPAKGDDSVAARQLTALRTKGRYDPNDRIQAHRAYLWIGVHSDLGTPPTYALHCALISFIDNEVQMTSPNCTHEDGRPLVEDITLKQFFETTLAVFDVVDLAVDPKPLTKPTPHSP